MPTQNGNPKQLNDGNVVYLRPEFTKGLSDAFTVRDAFVAVCEELDKLYTILGAHTGNGNALATALVGIERESLKLIDSKNGVQ